MDSDDEQTIQRILENRCKQIDDELNPGSMKLTVKRSVAGTVEYKRRFKGWQG